MNHRCSVEQESAVMAGVGAYPRVSVGVKFYASTKFSRKTKNAPFFLLAFCMTWIIPNKKQDFFQIASA